MTDVGPHLLGRIPSPPDLRDFRLGNFEGIGTETVATTPEALATYAASELRLTTITYKQWAARVYADVTVTHWWRAFNALAQIVSPPPVPTTDKVWSANFQLDQGSTPHCVGFGWCGWGDTAPVIDQFKDADGHAVYYECKVIDGHPGEEEGAYTRDGAKAMQNRGRLSVYAFADGIDQILTHLRTKGPVVIGSDWTTNMFNPDSNGFVKPTGSVEGGHCYLLYGVQGQNLLFKNSWGSGWGDNGSFRMTIPDFQVLLEAWGEAIASVELPL